MSDRIEDVLDFWFGELNELGCSSPEHRKRWWTKSDAFDEAIKSHFLGDYEAIVAGERDAWRNSARGALAYIITLDQFSRNMFRGTPEMFAADELAREVCCEGLDAGFDAELSFDERVFFYLPLEHSEEMADHRRCIELFEGLVDGAPEPLEGDAKYYLDFAARHKAIIEQYGRYPHRNQILGRASTPDEAEFLQEPGSSF
ncbi:MAG: DUF924 domain-containing protein [Deltaproteobacteria bacterium]|nr:DUF924 domain-containing protein [Deltaproteobacteria bacterium]MBW1874434.1 DUF924 domain-containing protein [Deltaproteobacteria bacterium]MBW2211613.1 DUF924 domain-containing protein [Deltaproteobacteria bacterium]MBW2213303.1 DUF924 domain-containing protein [Deltaproteobacteria bacterium]MBW2378620.1 DUF924 domain-containing protein [Deltaproteobacteria bacterium]